MNTQTSLVAEQVRLQQWAEQIKECQSRPADMKVDTWCAQHGLTKANYYYRLRRVREACLTACENAGASFVELQEPVVSPSDRTESITAAAILRTPDGITIEILNSASPELISNVIGALAYAQ